jgi:hypothetical protein
VNLRNGVDLLTAAIPVTAGVASLLHGEAVSAGTISCSIAIYPYEAEKYFLVCGCAGPWYRWINQELDTDLISFRGAGIRHSGKYDRVLKIRFMVAARCKIG